MLLQYSHIQPKGPSIKHVCRIFFWDLITLPSAGRILLEFQTTYPSLRKSEMRINLQFHAFSRQRRSIYVVMIVAQWRMSENNYFPKFFQFYRFFIVNALLTPITYFRLSIQHHLAISFLQVLMQGRPEIVKSPWRYNFIIAQTSPLFFETWLLTTWLLCDLKKNLRYTKSYFILILIHTLHICRYLVPISN